jgi:hypothetical protein
LAANDEDEDEVQFIGEKKNNNGLYFFDDIIEHRVVPSGFSYPEHAIEFLTEFTTGETIWLQEMCFRDDAGEYCEKYEKYCTYHGIRYYD